MNDIALYFPKNDFNKIMTFSVLFLSGEYQ